MDNQQLKQQLRQTYLTKRQAIDPHQLSQTSNQICQQLKELVTKLAANKIALYHPIRNEVNPLPLIKMLSNPQRQFLAPVTFDDSIIKFYPISSEHDFNFTDDQYGIPEPDSANQNAVTPDCLIMPGICYDRSGSRIGYGKGCYDRYLDDFNGQTIGIAPAVCLHPDQLPTEAFDQPVDYVVTETHLIKVSG